MGWSDAGKQYLVDNAATMTAQELATGVQPLVGDKTVEAIRSMCKVMGFKPKYMLRHKDGKNAWSDEELNYLDINAEKPITELMRHLGRPYKSITSKLFALRNTSEGMKQVTPFMDTMVETIPDLGISIYELSCELYNSGKRVEVKQRRDAKMALFCNKRRL